MRTFDGDVADTMAEVEEAAGVRPRWCRVVHDGLGIQHVFRDGRVVDHFIGDCDECSYCTRGS